MANRIPFKGLMKLAKGKLKEIKISDIKRYGSNFAEAPFKEKLYAVSKIAGENILLPVLKVYYIMKSPTIKSGEKALLVGALGYFILPMDFIPDFLAGLIGFSDDLMVIAFVLNKVSENMTPEIEAKANNLYRKIVGEKVASSNLLG